MKDVKLVERIANDPFHSGLKKHGAQAMSDEEIARARTRLKRLTSRTPKKESRECPA